MNRHSIAPLRTLSAAGLAVAPAVALAIGLLAGGGVASADMSKGVISAFRGQLVITKDDLPDEGKTDKDKIAKIKTVKLTELAGETNDDVTYWRFHYTAFLTRTGATSLKMEFYRDGKQYSADKRLDSVDPKSSVLTGDISIDENEGLAKGKSYVIKLVTEKDVVVASTPLTFK
jgi:hypothetical protein